MDKLVRKIEVPLARNVIKKAGLYIVQEKDLDHLAEVAADAYKDYPLHNYFTKGKYDKKASKLLMQISLKTMTEDAIIYADSEEMNGFAAWLPFGFTGFTCFYAVFLKNHLHPNDCCFCYIQHVDQFLQVCRSSKIWYMGDLFLHF